MGRTVNGTLVQGFLYQDQMLPVAQLDGSGNVVSRFVYGPQSNVPDYLLQGGNTYRIIADSLGSPRVVVNVSTGQVAEQLNYDEFGNVTLDTDPGFQPFGFAGGLYDHDTGLVRFGRRDYDPTTGRWTTKDPLGFGGGDSNLYANAEGDPINLVDPDGMTVNCLRKGNQSDLTLRITYHGLEATDQNIQDFNKQCVKPAKTDRRFDTAELALEVVKSSWLRELTLGPPGYSRTRACVRGAQSSNGPDQASELSSGVLVVSKCQLPALRP